MEGPLLSNHDESIPRGEEEKRAGNDPAHARNFMAALLSAFLSVTGGVSLGSIVFPADADHPNANFQVAGMQIGLLAATASSWVAYATSDVICGVPGGIFPPVIVLGSTYFKSIGPEYPHTIIFLLPLITFLQGVLLYLVARLPLENIVKGIPYIVFCGFLSGTGIVCIQSGLEMAANSTKMSDVRFWAMSTHWLPPLLAASVVYMCQQFKVPMKELLFPLSLLLLAICFYAVVWGCTGAVDLEALRDQGFLYKFELPASPSFHQVWTLQDFAQIQWSKIMDFAFLRAFLGSFCLTVITVVEDLYGVVESTALRIDFQKELENTALMNVVSGALGAMPTNLVMSYSVTAHRSGASSKSFLFWLSVISTMFFLVADYILSLTPIMVTAAALIWVGIAMSWDMLYHGMKRLSKQDYMVVWLMVVVDVTRGPDEMLMIGLAVTCMQLAYRLSSIEVLDAVHTSRTERSATLYASGKDPILEAFGDRVMIMHLARGLLFFGTAFQIQERIEHRVASTKPEDHKLLFLVLDMAEVGDSEVSGIKVLHFIVHELAEEHGFSVVFVGLAEKVKAKMCRFFGSEERLHEYPNVNEALRYVEGQLFRQYFDEKPASKQLLLGTIENRDLQVVYDTVQQHVADPLFLAVAVDLHSWLNNYVPEYDAEQVLSHLTNALEHKQYPRGTDICATHYSDCLTRNLENRSPLIWVLQGRVDLLLDTHGHWRTGPWLEVAGAGNSRRMQGDVVQIAEATAGPQGIPVCAGPLDTFRHFYSCFQWPPLTARVQSETATVAILPYAKFARLPEHVASIVLHYTSRKHTSHSALSRTYRF
eukprot:TRINITY_DN40957_c0_g1_i1.p1 TRINITY_DN40957_c0_g1~~TRINITY_DN40957_c0_g1_i1.p1  ORF type:complete len:821 (-),score=97.35 TRINITY_DN40957_c0_g1_i1:29-2491(-)